MAVYSNVCVVPDGKTSQALQDAHDDAISRKLPLYLGAGVTYNLTFPVNIRIPSVSVLGQSITFNCSGMTDQYAVKLDSTILDPRWDSITTGIEGIKFTGPGRIAGGQVALLVSGSAVGNSVRPFGKQVSISGFQTGLRFGDYSYLSQWHGFEARDCDVCVHQASGIDAGENIAFYGGRLYNSNSLILAEDDGTELFFDGTSFDYSKRFGTLKTNCNVELSNCHVEFEGSQIDPTDWLRMEGMMSAFTMRGGMLLMHGTGPHPYDHLFNMVDPNSNALLDNVTLNNLRNVSEKLATGPGYFDTTRCRIFPNGGGMPSRLSDSITSSVLVDGNMEASSVRDLWYIDTDAAPVMNRFLGSAIRILKTAQASKSGTQSLMLLKTSSGTASASLLIPLVGYERISSQINWWMQGAGTVPLQLQHVQCFGVDGNGVPVVSTPAGNSDYLAVLLNGASISWSQVNVRPYPIAPKWATHVRIRFDLTNLPAGNSLFLDDLSVHRW